MASLLRAEGIDADPALVGTAFRDHLDDSLPSANAFDHVILHVGPGDHQDELWIDATNSLQGGDAERARYSPFGRALVLRSGTTGLTPLAPEVPSDPAWHIRERYEMPEPDSHQPAHLEVVREFRHTVADRLRVTIGGDSRQQIAKSYLQVYAQQFAGIESDGPVTINDDRERNLLRVEARYTIRDPWKWSDERRRWELQVHPTLIGMYLEKPEVAGRISPLARVYPASVLCSLDLVMPHPWPLNPEMRTVTDPAFDFGFTSRLDGQTIHYDYSYVSRADHVPAAQLATHAAAVEKANQLLARVVTLRRPRPGANPWAWLAVLATVLGGALAARRLSLVYSPPGAAPADAPPEPLTGWLALIGLRLCVGPLMAVVQMAKSGWFFTADGWAQFVDPASASYRPAMAAVVMFEVIVQTSLIVYGILVAITFFKRRTSFPVHFTALVVATLAYNVLDRAAVSVLDVKSATAATPVAYVLQLVITALFVRYVLYSPQSKRTFTRP